MTGSSEEIAIRAGTDRDIPAVIALMKSALGEGKIPRTSEFWMWKHRHNPFGASPMWLAFSKHELVGVRLFMRWSFRHAAGHMQAVRAVDTATAPQFQGRGIFKRLTLGLVDEMKGQSIGFVFNTPNTKSLPGYLKMGWLRVGRTSLWLRARRPAAIARRLLRPRAPSEHDEISNAVTSDAALHEAATGNLPERCSLVLPGYRTSLSAAFLRWRYQQCPAATYASFSSDPQRALVVTRLQLRGGLRELAVSELLFERSIRGFSAAVQSLREALRAQPSDYAIAALRQDTAEAAALTASGFVPAPHRGPTLTVRDLSQVAPTARWGSSSLQASIGDLELF